MKNNKFICFTLLLLMAFSFADNIFAATNKRASRTKRGSSKKKVVAPVVVTDSTENVDDERANSVNARARGNATTTTTTSTSAVDDDTAAEILSSNLLTCIYSACYGDVPYEKCFQTGVAETYIRANSECLSLYNGAKSDLIRSKANALITKKIKSYFADSCSTAGGKVSGNVCKVQICYYAKHGDYKQHRCQDFNVGKTFTCSYQAFGLSDQDMEYKEEMTSEQLGTVINAGITAFTGLTQTAVSIVDTVQASKELKKKNILKGKDCKFLFSSGNEHITINDTDCKEKWTLCGSAGKKKDCEKGTNKCEDSNIVTDSAGNYYCKQPQVSFSVQPQACNSVKASDWGNTVKSCYVEFDEWTDLAVKEKEAELYKKFTDFKGLQFKDAVGAAYLQKTYANSIGVNLAGNIKKETCSFDVDVAGRVYGDYENICKQKAPINCSSSVDISTCKSMYSSYIDSKTIVSCSCEKTSDSKSSSDTSGNEEDPLLKAYKNGSFGKDSDTTVQTNNYSSAVETYNSMQKKVSEEKTKISNLEERKNAGLQNAIATGASTLVQSGGALTTALISANNNVGIMSGACYIGDPENGGTLFVNDGGAKKLTWNNL
ncbi:MAG: hypothetical protein ACI4N3_02330 [Alphaproteobacteria bacterium]